MQDPFGAPGATVSVGEYVRAVFGVSRSGAGFPGEWGCVGMLGAAIVACLGVTYCGLRFCNFQNR